jgi:ribonucleotide monophosphatase NagD (HAD superfamily)
MTWALDLDGVVWLAGRPIPGAAEAVKELRSAGQRVVFLTNNSGPKVVSHLQALSRAGIECQPADLTSSAQAAASLLAPRSRAAVIGDQGIREALAARGVQEVGPDEGPDAVVVGRTVELDYWALSAAASAIREGARFVATNTDATFPVGDAVSPATGRDSAQTGTAQTGTAQTGTSSAGTSSAGTSSAGTSSAGSGHGLGLLPGAGAIVAFLATASGRSPEVAGKPEEAMAALVTARYGLPDMVVGDRPDTDGRFAVRLETRFGLVLSGVTRRGDLPVEPAADLVGADLSDLVRQALRHPAS